VRVLASLLLLAALSGCGAPAADQPRTATVPPREQRAEMPPLPKMRPKLVQPAAGVAVVEDDPAATRGLATTSSDETSLPKPKGAASAGLNRSAPAATESAGAVDRATALPNGVALPPLDAPEAVMDIIRAGNTIARTPYKWGGGHGRWLDNGYDCSGSVAYALNAGGLIGGPATSGQLMSWGRPGKGRWVTIYANAGHVFMEVAGIRFDTSGASRTGSRWQNGGRPTAGFVARHPPGF
jgi:cell wall-associated NlpC family hydrolase